MNLLAHESSLYLRQHAANPVDWVPWGDVAWQRARDESRLVIVSIGFSACHWCHVMERESFEDPDIAAFMNRHFVCIKVDREERPDIDEIYMTAVQRMTGHGGWPMSVFLTPDGRPFYGGTYFPPARRHGRIGFLELVGQLASAWNERRDEVESVADTLAADLQESTRQRPIPGPAGPPDPDQLLHDAVTSLEERFDAEYGGFGDAPKFPPHHGLRLLCGAIELGDTRAVPLLTITLDRMAQGGLCDHVGGGFHRYCTDRVWLLPHFEKMLYDNAQLLELLALAWRKTGEDLFRRRAVETVEWLKREMIVAGGGFASSLDADSEGEEGKFYVWSLAEIESVLGAEDADFFAKAYEITREGNFEGHNIPNRLLSGSASVDEEARLAPLRTKLLEARAKRVRPGLDDKVLADWNGLMIAALANAGALFDEPAWIELGATAFRFLSDNMTREDRLGHSWREGRLLFPGLSSDYGSMSRAALALHRATGEQNYLDRAVAWERLLERHHASPETGGYFLTADDAGELILRPNSTRDDAIPNPHAWMGQNLVRLAALTGQYSYLERADRLFEAALQLAAANLFGHAALLAALDTRLRLTEIVVTGSKAEELAKAALAESFLASALLRAPDESSLAAAHPAREKVAAAKGESVALVCRGQTCSLPITEPAKLYEAIRA